MTTQQQVPQNNTTIQTLDDLKAEIKRVEGNIRGMEKDLQERLNKLPQETIKSTLGAAIPIFMNQAVASKTWGLIQNAGSLLFSAPGRRKGGIKETVFSSLKQVGLFAGLRALFSLWKKR